MIPANLIDSDILLIHGDMVFEESLISNLIQTELENAVLVNKEVELPDKDFKGLLANNRVIKIGVGFFTPECYLLMPVYKLSREFFLRWKEEMASFVDQGKTSVYAEDAFNEISHKLRFSFAQLSEGPPNSFGYKELLVLQMRF